MSVGVQNKIVDVYLPCKTNGHAQKFFVSETRSAFCKFKAGWFDLKVAFWQWIYCTGTIISLLGHSNFFFLFLFAKENLFSRPKNLFARLFSYISLVSCGLVLEHIVFHNSHVFVAFLQNRVVDAKFFDDFEYFFVRLLLNELLLILDHVILTRSCLLLITRASCILWKVFEPV